MTTTTEKKKDIELAIKILLEYKPEITSGKSLLMISPEWGKGMIDYFRVTLSYENEGRIEISHLTWAVAKVFGYRLISKNGYWKIGISGYGYSKTDEIARDLAHLFEIKSVRYETI